MSRPIFASVLLVALVALVPAAASAFTATLTIPGLCAAPVEVSLFSLEALNTTTIGSATGGAGAGKASFKPLVLSKAPDECTPLLFRALFLGQHADTATLTVGTKKAPVLFTIRLNTVFVTDLKHDFAKNGAGTQDDLLLETVTLQAASLTFTTGGTTVTCNQTTNTCQ